MDSLKRFGSVVFFVWILFFTAGSDLYAQSGSAPQSVPPTPEDIQFTNQMSRSEKDYQWGVTYFNSYQRTQEIPYLALAADFCLKAIDRLYRVQLVLSRTTKFYNQANQKRLRACQFYIKLQRQSFLLASKYHLRGSGTACQ